LYIHLGIVRERERERKRKRKKQKESVYVCVCVCERESVYVRETVVYTFRNYVVRECFNACLFWGKIERECT